MELAFSEDTEMLRQSLRRFVDERVRPELLGWSDAFPEGLRSELEELGLGGLGELAAEDPELGRSLGLVAIEECSRASGALGLLAALVIHGEHPVWSGDIQQVKTEGIAEAAPQGWQAFRPLGFRSLSWWKAEAGEAHAALPEGEWAEALGALALGMGRDALRRAVDYAQERKQFGRPIAAFQAIQFRLADAATDLESASVLLWGASAAGEGGTHRALLRALDAAQSAIDHAVQIFGGYGFTEEFEVERHYRDIAMLRALVSPDRLRMKLGAPRG